MEEEITTDQLRQILLSSWQRTFEEVKDEETGKTYYRLMAKADVDRNIECWLADRERYLATETEEKIEAIRPELEAKLKERLPGYGGLGDMGYCHVVWGVKKEILKEDYNIDWWTPAELNPHIKYD